MRVSGWSALVAWLLSATPLAAQEFIVGPWRGTASFHNATFTHCAIRATHGSWRLYFSQYPDGQVALALYNKALNFDKRHKLTGSVQLDGGPPMRHTFTAVHKDGVATRLGKADALRPFTRASRLQVRLGDVGGDWPLWRAGEAFAALSDCVAKANRLPSRRGS